MRRPRGTFTFCLSCVWPWPTGGARPKGSSDYTSHAGEMHATGIVPAQGWSRRTKRTSLSARARASAASLMPRRASERRRRPGIGAGSRARPTGRPRRCGRRESAASGTIRPRAGWPVTFFYQPRPCNLCRSPLSNLPGAEQAFQAIRDWALGLTTSPARRKLFRAHAPAAAKRRPSAASGYAKQGGLSCPASGQPKQPYVVEPGHIFGRFLARHAQQNDQSGGAVRHFDPPEHFAPQARPRQHFRPHRPRIGWDESTELRMSGNCPRISVQNDCVRLLARRASSAGSAEALLLAKQWHTEFPHALA